jgi:exopolyphosphatase / guanosine-5'-triphosphate,3'-diphosphate pyrophosphatase
VEARLVALARLGLPERTGLPCIGPGRADLIVPGIAILTATMDCLGADSMQVSDWGIREGIIVDVLEGGG